ncbi:MAG TPA: OmpH family outer membrane protein [Allosphingosinicella sp.]|nr:OmpH family outer membrane protein [Allosphingosinicella sp.]
MTRSTFGAALAALSLAVPAAAPAQRLGGAVIAVVDTGRVFRECNACRTAMTQLQARGNQLRQRTQQLTQPLQTEGQSIQAAVRALNGRQPDAALQQRITAFEGKRTSAAQEVQRGQQNLESIQASVNQQIGARLGPILNQVMQTRGATLIVDKGATLANSPALDVTADVLAQLNQQLPSVSLTPLARPQQQQPQGR